MEHDYSREDAIKSFFGNKHRIDVAAAVGHYSVEPPELFRGPDVSEKLLREQGIYDVAVHRQLQVLESLGMVRREPNPQSGPSNYYDTAVCYTRLDSPWWKIVEVAVQVMDEQFPEG
jgi:predicted transcriptional regulator